MSGRYKLPQYVRVSNSRVFCMVGDSHIFTHFRYLITSDFFNKNYQFQPGPISYELILTFDFLSEMKMTSADVVNNTDVEYQDGNILFESDYMPNIVRYCIDNHIEIPESLFFMMAS